MKEIRIKICSYDPKDKFSYGHFLVGVLSKFYEVELSETPDYLFYNESTTEHLRYDCIKIFYTGENVSPDFNFCDYATGFDYLTFQDRYCRLPLYLITQFYSDDEVRLMADSSDITKQIPFTKDDLAQKSGFCSFVYSNYRSDPFRETFFNALNSYKPVSSGGKYLNNVGGPVPNKIEFEMKHKFSIAFENSSRSGYTTEKLANAIAARTIPIYWGNPDIAREFNRDRFINCHDYDSIDAVIDRVREIDADDDLFISIMNQRVQSDYDFDKAKAEFERFLRHIFDQDIRKAKRRTINPVREQSMRKAAQVAAHYSNLAGQALRFGAYLYRPFRKSKTLEDIKHRLFRKKQ